MLRSQGPFLLVLALFFATLASVAAQPSAQAWESVISAIDADAQFPQGSMVVGSDDLGVIFNYTKGAWNPSSKYIVASASKWMSSTAIWVAIEQGKLSVSDKVNQWIPWWTTDVEDSRSNITLAHLLSFTSGFTGDTCNATLASLTACAEAIYAGGVSHVPGARFYYGGDHLQIAGLMTLYAVGETNWNDYFEESVLLPLGLTLSDASFWTDQMPLLAGTLRTSANIYTKLLQAIYTNISPPLLNMTTRALRESDWTAGLISLYNPSFGIGQNWHYSSSFWVMCPYPIFNSTCNDLHQYSSPGKFGYMPFIDRINDFWVLVSTYNNAPEAFAISTVLLQEVLPTITQNVADLRASSPSASGPEAPEAGSPVSPASGPQSSGTPSPSSDASGSWPAWFALASFTAMSLLTSL